MMRFIIFIQLVAAMNSLQAPSPSYDNLQPGDIQGFVAQGPEIQSNVAETVNSLIDSVMDPLNGNLKPGMKQLQQLQLGATVDIQVNPTFDIGVSNHMPGAFHDNNNAYSVDGMVTRINGGTAVADFQNSLHNNNNAIGKGDVERLNGVGVDVDDESTNATLNSALNAMASMSSSVIPSNSSLLQKVQRRPFLPESLLQKMHKRRKVKHTAQELGGDQDSDNLTLPSIVNDSVRHDIGRDSFDALIKIEVNPAIKISAFSNMSGAFYNNNNAASEKGQVQRVNGALAVANFSSALHDNNKALSTDGTVKRINGGYVR